MTADQRTTPAAVRMHQLLSGFEVSQALYVVAELGVATALLDGPRRVADLAVAVGADVDALERLIRFLASLGVFRTSGGDVEITELGEAHWPMSLRARCAQSPVIMQTHYAPFGRLLHTVRTGEVAATAHLGQPFFDWINATPGLAELQNSAMAGFTTGGRGDLFDRLQFPQGDIIADIGGADGTVLAEILSRLPGAAASSSTCPGSSALPPPQLPRPGSRAHHRRWRQLLRHRSRRRHLRAVGSPA